MRHSDQIKFALALTDDTDKTFRMFDLVCEPLLGDVYRSVIKAVTKELDVDPVCNPFYYYVEKLPLKRRSRWYLFDEVSFLRSEYRADGTDVTNVSETCGVWIGDTDLPREEILTALSKQKQTITYLRIGFRDIYPRHIDSRTTVKDGDINFPQLDGNARYFHIEYLLLPLNIEEDLGHQLSSRDKLQHLHIPKMTHTAPLIVRNIAAKTNLTHLDIRHCGLPEDLCIILCEQLQSLHRLQYLNLSKNHIGSEGAERLAESIASWGPDSPLKSLYLSGCNIEASGAEKLLAALASCTELVVLFITNNRIGGAFEALSPRLVCPRLWDIWTVRTSLTEGDIRSIAARINNQGLPRLDRLWLRYQKLAERSSVRDGDDDDDDDDDEVLSEWRRNELIVAEILKTESDEMLEAWRTIAQKVEDVRLLEGNVSIFITQKKTLIEQEVERRSGV